MDKYQAYKLLASYSAIYCNYVWEMSILYYIGKYRNHREEDNHGQIHKLSRGVFKWFYIHCPADLKELLYK